MRAMRAIVVCTATVAAMLVASTAWADELRLAWRAPIGCPSGERVREAVLKAAGTASARESLDVDARVERGERWQVTIRTTRNGTVSAERRLEAASCAALADATAVIVAIAMIPPGRAAEPTSAKAKADADAREQPTRVKADGDVPEQPTGVKADEDTMATADEDAKAEAKGSLSRQPVGPPAAAREARGPAAAQEAYRRRLAGSVAGVTDGTTLPAAALGARVGVAWTPGRARLEVGGSYFSAQSKTADSSAAGARFTLLVAGGRACWALLQGDVELAPCAGADVQMVSASGFGATQNYDAGGTWMSAAGGGLVRLPLLSWLALRAHADAIVPMTRPRFVVEGDGAVHRPSAIGGRVGIGAELLFL